MTPECPKRPLVRVRTDHLRAVALRHGLMTDQATAERLGISAATLSRTLHGATAGGRVIAAIWHAFALDGTTRIDDLLTVDLVAPVQDTLSNTAQLS